MADWYNLVYDLRRFIGSYGDEFRRLSLRKNFSIAPKRVLQGLFWLAIALGLVVGILGIQERQHAQVVIEWTTATEIDTIGFNLYRSESPADHYMQINEGYIPAAADPFAGGSYRYTDTDVRPGRVYYYQLEEIESSGVSSRHGPIEVKAIAGGGSELILAATLLGIGALGLLSMKKPSGPADERETL